MANLISGAGGFLRSLYRAAGDLVIGGTGGVPETLPIGDAGTVLTSVSGEPAWAATSDDIARANALVALQAIAPLQAAKGQDDVARANAIAALRWAIPNPGNPALVVNPPVSGTAYQNPTSRWLTLIIPVSVTVAETVQLALGATSTVADWGAAEALAVAASPKNFTLRVPPGWWFSVTTGGTIGTVDTLGE